MTRWVALLRGVNVGGVTIRSADLAALVRELDVDAVKTVLATGNVAFDAEPEEPAELKTRLETALGERFGYRAQVVLRTQQELAEAVAGYPFDAEDPALQPYLIFGSDPTVLADLATTAEPLVGDGERLQLGDGVLYWQVPKGHSTDTAVAKEVARARYRESTTNRNLRTVRRLLTA